MKKALFFIDDVVWVFRDLTRQKSDSLFDNPFLKVLKNAYDRYGVKTQLNIFYQTDFFYGNDLFTLSDMTDAYKSEWEECSDWLKFGFHAKHEFPDYPYINASYEHVKENYEAVKNEVIRFAGINSMSISTTPHWRPISKDACKAMYDCGLRLVSATYGEKIPYDGNAPTLNVITKEEIEPAYSKVADKEFVCYGLHEQYFNEDYYAYQSDYAEKVYLSGEILSNNNYGFIFGGDLI